jgi:hypothetical protein
MVISLYSAWDFTGQCRMKISLIVDAQMTDESRAVKCVMINSDNFYWKWIMHLPRPPTYCSMKALISEIMAKYFKSNHKYTLACNLRIKSLSRYFGDETVNLITSHSTTIESNRRNIWSKSQVRIFMNSWDYAVVKKTTKFDSQLFRRSFWRKRLRFVGIANLGWVIGALWWKHWQLIQHRIENNIKWSIHVSYLYNYSICVISYFFIIFISLLEKNLSLVESIRALVSTSSPI